MIITCPIDLHSSDEFSILDIPFDQDHDLYLSTASVEPEAHIVVHSTEFVSPACLKDDGWHLTALRTDLQGWLFDGPAKRVCETISPWMIVSFCHASLSQANLHPGWVKRTHKLPSTMGQQHAQLASWRRELSVAETVE